MPPFTVDEKFILVLALGQIDDCYKIPMALHHRQRFPLVEGAADVDVLAAALPLEHCWQYLSVGVLGGGALRDGVGARPSAMIVALLDIFLFGIAHTQHTKMSN